MLRIVGALVAFLSLGVLVGCADGDLSDARKTGGTCAKHGVLTDLSKEPNYTASYVHRWTTEDGCAVRLDILMRRQGDEACGGSRVADILMGWPLGRSHDKPRPHRIFVRDPSDVFGDEATSEAFVEDAELPKEATDTGFRQQEDGAQLWMVDGNDSFTYVVYEDRIERWPLDESPPGCA